MRTELIPEKDDDYPFNVNGCDESSKYIIDDSGFIINSKGRILPVWDYKGKVFSVVNLSPIFFADLIKDYSPSNQWRRIKFLKSKNRWRAECPNKKEDKLYYQQWEAAERANELAEGTDWIPNVIPNCIDILKESWLESGISVKYTKLEGSGEDSRDDIRVFLALSTKTKLYILDTKENAKYIEEHISRFKGIIVAVHMDPKPRFIKGTAHHEVKLPKDKPYKTMKEYRNFAVLELNKLCHIAGDT